MGCDGTVDSVDEVKKALELDVKLEEGSKSSGVEPDKMLPVVRAASTTLLAVVGVTIGHSVVVKEM